MRLASNLYIALLSTGILVNVFHKPAFAREEEAVEPLYDIEVLVFSHQPEYGLKPETATDFVDYPSPQAHPSENPELTEQQSPGMESAWRKLNNSGAYQPHLFARWRQAASDYTNPLRLRLHDDQVLFLPKDDHEETGDPLSSFGDLVVSTSVPEPATSASEGISEEETSAEAEGPPPDPAFYAFDGWISFSHQRFFHIGLNFERRIIDPWLGENAEALSSIDRIEQQRQIEPGRFEYFDTPGLSVLVRVTEVPEEELEEWRLRESLYEAFPDSLDGSGR